MITKKRQKILIQTGAVMLILFTIVTIIVGNMITMTSFSSVLSERILDGAKANSIYSDMFDYESIEWLTDYWINNSDTLFTNGPGQDDLKGIVYDLGKVSATDVTDTEADRLSPEDQRAFAAACYMEINSLFIDCYDSCEGRVVYAASQDPNVFIIFDTDAPEGNIPLGNIESSDIYDTAGLNALDVLYANPIKWAFHLPDDDMLMLTAKGVTEDAEAYLFCFDDAASVYENMLFTDYIRNSVIIMLICVFVLIMIFIYWIVPRPLAKVKQSVIEYGKTKNANELRDSLSQLHSRNEIGDFADGFSHLAFEMERYTREVETLAKDKERVETELNIGRDIQMQMLPKVFPVNDKFVMFASMDAAKVVGGDFYDCYMLDDDHLVLTIADVSGKGVPASLFMAVSKAVIKNRTLTGGTPSQILYDVNNRLTEGNDSMMFVTVWHAILTISTGELICANGGHEYPGLRSGDKAFELIKTEHGPVLGIMEGSEYTDERYTLAPGDALFVYTDGVPEANNAEGEMFGEERLEAVLAQIGKGDTPETIAKAVRKAVDDFACDTPQYDDVTMLCLVMT